MQTCLWQIHVLRLPSVHNGRPTLLAHVEAHVWESCVESRQDTSTFTYPAATATSLRYYVTLHRVLT